MGLKDKLRASLAASAAAEAKPKDPPKPKPVVASTFTPEKQKAFIEAFEAQTDPLTKSQREGVVGWGYEGGYRRDGTPGNYRSHPAPKPIPVNEGKALLEANGFVQDANGIWGKATPPLPPYPVGEAPAVPQIKYVVRPGKVTLWDKRNTVLDLSGDDLIKQYDVPATACIVIPYGRPFPANYQKLQFLYPRPSGSYNLPPFLGPEKYAEASRRTNN